MSFRNSFEKQISALIIAKCTFNTVKNQTKWKYTHTNIILKEVKMKKKIHLLSCCSDKSEQDFTASFHGSVLNRYPGRMRGEKTAAKGGTEKFGEVADSRISPLRVWGSNPACSWLWLRSLLSIYLLINPEIKIPLEKSGLMQVLFLFGRRETSNLWHPSHYVWVECWRL